LVCRWLFGGHRHYSDLRDLRAQANAHTSTGALCA
jgi:hypothetical protein